VPTLSGWADAGGARMPSGKVAHTIQKALEALRPGARYGQVSPALFN
jgi:hypothetical protein